LSESTLRNTASNRRLSGSEAHVETAAVETAAVETAAVETAAVETAAVETAAVETAVNQQRRVMSPPLGARSTGSVEIRASRPVRGNRR
jgi:hypothetical protein